MVKTVHEAEKYLESLSVIRSDYSERLAFVKSVLGSLGDPQDRTPAIHIAGTSGKGSTAYYASALLRAMGYRVGLAVSPHVNSVTERSQINSVPLEEDEYCRYFNQFVGIIQERKLELSYIEFLTIFTYWLFSELQLDYMVIEVGLGGRLDPTNVISRQDTVRVITDIGLDHMEFLGNTVAKIAGEKAGVIHHGDVVLTHQQPAEVMEVIQHAVTHQQASLTVIDDATLPSSTLPGFQQRNWTLARGAVVKRLSLDQRHALSAVAESNSLATVIPGRFETFEQNGQTIILDAAHNPQKIAALVQAIKQAYPEKAVVYVVAFGKNKQASLEENIKLLQTTASALIATTFAAELPSGRSAINPQEITELAKRITDLSRTYAIDDPYAALEYALNHADQTSEVIVVTGSFYLLDGIRSLLLRRAEEVQK